jgi:pyruvate/2-oxoglutarate dehydrogenase complex dihydrolipoamide dehydrogenase (E3) component
VPSKCIIRSARAAADVRRAGEFGVRVGGGVDVDFAAVMERMRKLRSRISPHDSAGHLRGLGVDVFFGEGRFSGPDAVAVAGVTLRFSKAVIATGARAVEPPIEGLAQAGYLTNETVFSLTERPRRLAVFGAGPLGSELAQAFRRLGSEVTIIEKADQFLTREDRDAAEILARAFRRDGVEVRLNTTLDRVSRSGEGEVLHVTTDGRADTIVADEILVGAGRAPNVQDLGLETVGVEYHERKGIAVDERLRTTNPRIYAAGDVCLKHKFTHTADAAARIVVQNALFWGRKKLSALVVPWCTYTDPEIAHVGMYATEARENGIEVDTFTQPHDEVDRAVADGETEGFVRVHTRKGTDIILGATIVASHAGEMISEITTAMVAGVGLGRLAGVIHPYPTQAEGIKHVADMYNRTRLTPLRKRILTRILEWRR